MTKIVRKLNTGKVAGGLSFVLSDATVDRYGDIIEPTGWQLDNFRRNPVALFGHQASFPIGTWSNVRVDKGQLLGDLEPAEPGTSPRVDEIISLVRQDVLRATSVGFLGLEHEPIDPKQPYDAWRYTKSELVECSVVSIPANPNSLAVARELGISRETQSLVFGRGSATTREVTTTGRSAPNHPKSGGNPMPTPISRQIEETQARLNAARDGLAELTRDPDHDSEAADLFTAEIDQAETRLVSLKRTEKALGPGAGNTTSTEDLPAPAVRSTRAPFGVPVKKVTIGDLVIRAAVCSVTAHVRGRSVDQVLRDRYNDDEATGVVTRAAMTGATTTVAGWASELVETAYEGFLDLLSPDSIFLRAAPHGVQLTFGQNAGIIKIPSRAATPSVGGSFVAEGAPIPVRRLGTSSISLTPHKVGVLTVFSREVAAYSNPQIEGVLQDAIRTDTSIIVDGLFIDNVAASVIRPAGLTNGVVAITAATGGGATAIIKDITALAGAFYAQNAGRDLLLFINPREGLNMANVPGPVVPGAFGWTSAITQRMTILESTNIPAGTLVMIDARDLASVSGGLNFETSEFATLHMEDTTPLNIGTPGSPPTVAAPVQSMFQTGQIALRMLANLTWAMRRTGMVQTITGANWALP
jgi:HK97 family phage prohead protease